MKRLFAFLLCVALLLSGCGQKSQGAANAGNVTEPPMQPPFGIASPLPNQQHLSEKDLTPILEQIDFSLLAAAFLNDEELHDMDLDVKSVAYVGDADNNGHMEMVYTDGILFFENINGDKVTTCIYNGAGAPKEIYIANDSSIYVHYSKEPLYREHGDHEHVFGQSLYYRNNKYDNYTMVVAKDSMECDCGVDLSFGMVGDREVSWEELNTYRDGLDLLEINGSLSQCVSCTYDGAYCEAIVDGLHDYLTDFYNGYLGQVICDVDDDGFYEAVFVVNRFVSRWLENYSSTVPGVKIEYASPIEPVDNRTGFLIADYENGKVTINSGCISELISVLTSNTEPVKSGTNLIVEGKTVTVRGWNAEDITENNKPAPLTLAEARNIYGVYATYCLYGVCEVDYDYVEGSLKQMVLTAAGISEDAMGSFYAHIVPCCSTIEESMAHVRQNVELSFIPDSSDMPARAVEYNGALYSVFPGMGYSVFVMNTNPIMVDDTHAVIQMELQDLDYVDPNYTGYFAWLDGSWKITGIQRGISDIPVQDYTTLCNSIALHAESFGYKNTVIKHVDLGDSSTDELLCLCQKDGVWYLIIYIVVNGEAVQKNTVKLDGQACYLTERDGRTCLLTYQQNVSGDGSNTYHSYSYALFRFDGDGNTVVVEEDSIGYYSSDTGAQKVATFFEKLNKYLVKIIVIYDPFKLTGKTFMEQKEASFGQVPQEPEPEQSEPQPEPEKVQMGFVQIQDPNSWLNLREGPGLNYECVRMDPNDPGSIVRQALGSPVTVLEEVQGADGVWLKIRITYQDREIVGYSYKAYIRLAGE